MKVLFLDVDGVLNSRRSCVAFGGYPMELEHIHAFDQIAIRLLQRLCDAAGVKIVFSSAWRLYVTPEQAAEAFGLPIIDKTPFNHGRARGTEIQDWLDAHPEIECYAILDDNSDMMTKQLPYFVQTPETEGLSWECYEKLCGLFGVSAYAGEPRHRNWRNAAKLDWSEA